MRNTTVRRERSDRLTGPGRSRSPARTLAWLSTALLSLTFAACGAVDSERVAVSRDHLVGASAAGVIPDGLPDTMSVGLFEVPNKTWMKSSGVPWTMRYTYFTKGWVNNWGHGADDGSVARDYLEECDQGGFIPVVEYYEMNDEPGGGEHQFLRKAQNAMIMSSYFNDFKVLMQRIKEFGKPVLVQIEADGFAYIERQSGHDPDTYAAIRNTGLPELFGLPNTVAGWGLAFLQLRKAVGATNAILGMHVASWQTDKDIVNWNVSASDPIEPEVDKAYEFLSPLGLAPNVTGATYDVLVGDPLDRDADYHKLVNGMNLWWDPSDTAPISSKSFNRHAEWLRLWNVKSGKRWVLWQIPIGNSYHLDVPNNGGPRQGWKDNRPEYFFGGGTAHLVKYANAGVIALMFGTTKGQSSYENDYYSDGKLFMKSRVDAFFAAGGLPLAGSPSSSSSPFAGGKATLVRGR